MANIILSPFASGQRAVVNGDCAGDIVVNNYFVDVTAAQIVAGDIVDIGPLPAGHTVVGAILAPDDLDTNGTPTIALDVGLMSGTPGSTDTSRTCGAEIFSASQAARTGTTDRPTLTSAFRIQSVEYDRSIGVKFNTAAATAAAGRIRLSLHIAPSDGQVF